MGNLKSNKTKEEWDDLVDKSKQHSRTGNMTGELIKSEHGWMISYTENGEAKGVSLHYDDVDYIRELEFTFDNIEARIAANPIVEFEIVENQKMSGVSRYGKLVNENSKCPICGFKKDHSKHCRTKQRHLRNKRL
jgi:hypothetical protein